MLPTSAFAPPFMIRFRTSTPQDAPALAKVWRSSVLATHDFLLPEDFQKIDRWITTKYLPATTLQLAVDIHDAPLGFIGLTHNNIDTLFITPEHRGKGIGRALLALAEAQANALGCNLLCVDVNEQNQQALEFYKCFGFIQHSRSALDSEGRPYPLLHMTKPL